MCACMGMGVCMGMGIGTGMCACREGGTGRYGYWCMYV
jgi:hypothetical protein